MFRKSIVAALAVAACGVACAFEYNVRQPSEALRPKWFAADTAPGAWTLNVGDALQKAKAAGKCAILLNTASWWCPFCETLEDLVLKSAEWQEYVEENGFYLAMLDFPYRGHVTDDQVWKSYHPEFGDGWGFKCWLMNPEFLASVGLTEAEGLDAITAEYALQDALATPGASTVTIQNWRGDGPITYHRVGYPAIVVYGPDGAELGRVSFPWSSTADVTPSEAREYVMQAIEILVNGNCELCHEPISGDPLTDAAQVYNGWLTDMGGIFSGTVQLKTSKRNSKGLIKLSGSMTVNGKKTSFVSESVERVDRPLSIGRGVMRLTAQFGESGLTGAVTVAGTQVYRIAGGSRDVFKAKDAQAVAKAARCPMGTWGVVLKSSDVEPASPFARGDGSLSIKVKSKGKVSVTGTFGDGTRISKSLQLIMGDDGVACIPLAISAYGKKGGLGFVVWFKNGKLLNFADATPWIAAGKNEFRAKITPMFTMSSGTGTVPSELDLTMPGFDPNGTIYGLPLETDPSLDEVTVSGLKWRGTEESGFKASCSRTTGLLRGSMTFRLIKANGKTKKVRGAFDGVVLGGAGYGTVVVSREGSWPVKIAVCGGCGD